MATQEQIRAAWDLDPVSNVETIEGVPASTPLSQVVTDDSQATLNAQLEHVKIELLATDYPLIDLDSGKVEDVITAPEFLNAPGKP